MEKELGVLFIGDVFGQPGIDAVKKHLPELKQKYQIDLVIAQGENTSGRKGLNYEDYQQLKNSGVNVITLGNHVWANQDIFNFIESADVLRPYNVDSEDYPGHGTNVFNINNIKIRVTSMLGRNFNKLNNPWKQSEADSFFDAYDEIENSITDDEDFHVIDFHAETTSEKNVFGLYLDGKADALVGTHTHVQTNDAKILPEGLLYITDAGMTGPANAAIGANFQEVYEKMRYDKRVKFVVSQNPTQFNGVYLFLSTNKKHRKIVPINIF
ncbi:TIGR00282 family metallophosphoesterase [Mycoplasma procyoni]|uniref:TIGR00282 family metallophosphoesterase n=1 Tax=Mycoplasma procyoni TaxID=568784 RepID=UPI00197C95A1|nr:TIGR00282 family metallophosphoesterase [Mycoplasma procyoni]MBN3534876.1 TIGR00282 family metallophosphoesterase [Mycoplasma procyoni]